MRSASKFRNRAFAAIAFDIFYSGLSDQSKFKHHLYILVGCVFVKES